MSIAALDKFVEERRKLSTKRYWVVLIYPTRAGVSIILVGGFYDIVVSSILKAQDADSTGKGSNSNQFERVCNLSVPTYRLLVSR